MNSETLNRIINAFIVIGLVLILASAICFSQGFLMGFRNWLAPLGIIAWFIPAPFFIFFDK